MQLFSITDLCHRWCYTRAGVHKLIRSKNFPPVSMAVSRGRVKLFSAESIEHYEKGKTWLFDEAEKRRRQRLFLCLQTAKEDPTKRADVLRQCFGKSVRQWQ